MGIGDWGLGIGGLGVGGWGGNPHPPTPQSPIPKKKMIFYFKFKLITKDFNSFNIIQKHNKII